MGTKSKSLKRPHPDAATKDDVAPEEVPLTRRSDDEPVVKQSRWTNKTRVLVLAYSNISHRGRHLMTDFRNMMPHGKADSKMQKRESLFSVNEITAMWKRVMSFNFTLTLFRNETINVFKLAEETLDRRKSGVFSKMKNSSI